MEWDTIFEKPWQIVTLDLTDLTQSERFTDPTITKPPILKVKHRDQEPNPSQETYRAPKGYVFSWHDLQRKYNTLFVGVLKRDR